MFDPIKALKEKIQSAGDDIGSINEAILEYAERIQLHLGYKLERSSDMTSQEKAHDESGYLVRQSVRNIELMVLRNAKEVTQSPVQEIENDVQTLFESIFTQLKEVEDARPEKLLSTALSAIDSLDEKRFLLTNLLESLKKGESYHATLKRFNNLGVTNIPVQEPEEAGKEKTRGHGSGIIAAVRKIKQFTQAVYQVVLNAIRSLPRFMELKPRIGISGVVPTVSFELDAAGVTVQELYELMTGRS